MGDVRPNRSRIRYKRENEGTPEIREEPSSDTVAFQGHENPHSSSASVNRSFVDDVVDVGRPRQ